MRWSSEGEHNPIGSLCHLSRHSPSPGGATSYIIQPPIKRQKLALPDDLRNLGLHFQGLDQISGD